MIDMAISVLLRIGAPTLLLVVLVGCGGGGGEEARSTALIESESPTSKVALSVIDSLSVRAVSFEKVSEVRVGRTVYDYVYKVGFQNNSIARSGIVATVTGAAVGTSIIDGSILVGDLAANAKVLPVDTITLRVDRAYPFNSASLSWDISSPINGFPVPPEPDAVQNLLSLAGIDTNGNGVRDDIERLLARNATNASDFASALSYAKQWQSIVTTPPPTTRLAGVQRYSKVICAFEAVSPSVRKVDMQASISNTPSRSAAIRAFFGVMIAYTSSELASCAV